MKHVLTYVVLVIVASIGACSPRVAMVDAAVLYFMEQEPEIEPYRTRVIVTADFVRFDDGRPDGDFTLYARKEKAIYSVTTGDKMVLRIAPEGDVGTSSIKLVHDTRELKSEAPAVGGKPARHLELRTNGSVCYDVHTVDGLLPDALMALREFISVLAQDQARSLSYTPKELQTPCHLANNVFAATRYLEHGLPIRRADMTGRISELVDYEARSPVAADLFVLPESFRRVDIRELREKK